MKKRPQNNCSSVTSILLHILTVVEDWGLSAAALAVTGLEESWRALVICVEATGRQSEITVGQLKRLETEKERQGIYIFKHMISEASSISRKRLFVLERTKEEKNIFGRVVGMTHMGGGGRALDDTTLVMM